MVNLTKKQLEALVADLQKDVESLTLARAEADDNLRVAQTTIQEQLEALTAAQAQAAAAEETAAAAIARATAAEEARAALQTQLEQATTAAAAANQQAAAPDFGPDIQRPTGSGWSIREAMELDPPDDHENDTYAPDDQRTVRSLVIRAQLDWTDDFRRQDADKLATLFRAVRPA
ncbi:hypothetical protein BV20DRAFT_967527 [Pilatotrama ljubarskyi]|nr:hypothetical protein BV20DRAFT_967527 [Pilatotrama ljubarskyi]